jgi:hypothetical protein
MAEKTFDPSTCIVQSSRGMCDCTTQTCHVKSGNRWEKTERDPRSSGAMVCATIACCSRSIAVGSSQHPVTDSRLAKTRRRNGPAMLLSCHCVAFAEPNSQHHLVSSLFCMLVYDLLPRRSNESLYNGHGCPWL